MADEGLKAALVADDNEVNRRLLSALMRKFGFSVAAACDGREAVQLAREKRFDCILMDIDMPHMTGLEATRAIRHLPGRHGRVPIIAVTSRVDPTDVAECAEAGMDAHLGKPVSIGDLYRLVSVATSRRRHPAAPSALRSLDFPPLPSL